MVNTDPSKGHAPIDHEFTIDEFKYENEVHYQPCVKVSFYFKKRKDVSHEHFFKHWAHVHADLTLASRNFGQFKCQRYTQHHQFPEMKQGLAKIGMKTMDYDGCSTLWFKSWKDFEGFFTSPDYEGKLTEDCKGFMDDEAGINVFAGQDFIAFGKGIPGIDDQDGITEYCETK
ncbi:Fc.00g042080.m01.CDS01 [Cosmosporella sp. VM-42]